MEAQEGKRGPRSGISRVRSAEREATVVRLILAGASQAQIAAQIGVSPGSGAVSKILNRAIAKLYPVEDVQTLRAMMLARYEALVLSLWQQGTAIPIRTPDGKVAGGPDLEAQDRLLRILAAERQLAGLDAPAVLELSGSLDHAEAESEADRELREEWERWFRATDPGGYARYLETGRTPARVVLREPGGEAGPAGGDPSA